MALIVQLEK
jgi:hypothetical protein